MFKCLQILLILLSACFCGCGKRAEIRFVTIGTGGMTGVYYPTGGYIARMVNQKKNIYGLSCTHESTGGSVFNINSVLIGDMMFGIAQSDRQYQAVEGLAEWAKQGKQPKLRAVFSIHPEAVTLIAAADAGISSIADLKGKRVNIGNPGSGQRQNAIDALQSAGLDYNKDIKAENVKAMEAPSLLQDDRIDAFFYTVGHPSGAIKEATSGKRKVKLIPITNIAKLLEEHPYYAQATVPCTHYPSAINKNDTATFGVKATLITSSDVPDDVVYAITKEVFDNLTVFKKLHPAYETLTVKSMLEGLSAPIHPGALRYYNETGLIKEQTP
ncbi:MAG: TAXI family TRAP transporter solute-binding subunit [Kiritimatiellae bacterium]|nr:TAXI family TRAP transporter solute-binding subunit [Kiritimatiellia bacterium]